MADDSDETVAAPPPEPDETSGPSGVERPDQQGMGVGDKPPIVADDPTLPEPAQRIQPEPAQTAQPTQRIQPVQGQPTSILPPADDLGATRLGGPPGSAEIGPSGTSVLPAVPAGPAAPPKWTARAQVPQPGQDTADADWEGTETAWDEAPPPSPPRLWGPILIALVVLVLVAILGFGLWLLLRGRAGDTVPTPTDTVPAVTTGPTTVTRTTTAVQTTVPPTTAPAMVAIPSVAGTDYGTAAATLQGLGFQTKRGDRTSTTVAAGTVIGTDPNTEAPAGSLITILVSTGPPPTTRPPATSTPTPIPTPTP